MSKWLPVFLCCFATNAFASSADSGSCPWKMPFTITIHGTGALHRYQNSNNQLNKMCLDEDYGMESSESDFGFTLDRSVAYWESLGDSNIILRYSLNTDTLQFFL